MEETKNARRNFKSWKVIVDVNNLNLSKFNITSNNNNCWNFYEKDSLSLIKITPEDVYYNFFY